MPLEAHGIKELAAKLDGIDADLRVDLEPAVLDAGEIIAKQARANYSWSSAIGAGVSVSARWSARGGGAEVRVSERGYPHAGEVRTLEGNGEAPTEFFHRVYGNPNAYRPMMTRPSFYRALPEKEGEATGVIATAVARVFTI